MRLFLSIFPSKEFRDYFRDVVRAFSKEKRNLKPLNLEQMHLTVRFIGANVSPTSKNKVVNELRRQEGSFPKPMIKLERLQFGFPRQHDPRVLFASIEANEELNELHDRVHKLIRGLKRSDTIVWKSNLDNAYHMTLARLKPAATRSSGRHIQEILSSVAIPRPEAFTASEIYLMESQITPRGPVYRKLELIKL